MTQQEEEHDPLVHDLQRLSDQLMVLPLDGIPDPASFLSTFLDVIRQEHTSGHTTGIALSSVNKFLSYGIISECVCVCMHVCIRTYVRTCAVHMCVYTGFACKAVF